MSTHKIPDMCDPDNRHRHECPNCHAVEECDEKDCRFIYAGYGSKPGDELSPPAAPVTCSGTCFFAEVDKMNAGRPVVTCISCGSKGFWNVEGRCYDCDKNNIPPKEIQ